jgi:hypothetical protein
VPVPEADDGKTHENTTAGEDEKEKKEGPCGLPIRCSVA